MKIYRAYLNIPMIEKYYRAKSYDSRTNEKFSEHFKHARDFCIPRTYGSASLKLAITISSETRYEKHLLVGRAPSMTWSMVENPNYFTNIIVN